MEATTNSVENTEEEKTPDTNATENIEATTEAPKEESGSKPAADSYATVTVEDMQDEKTAEKFDRGEQY